MTKYNNYIQSIKVTPWQTIEDLYYAHKSKKDMENRVSIKTQDVTLDFVNFC